MSNSKYLQGDEASAEEFKDLISTLPRERGWLSSHIYQYQGFWYEPTNLASVISCQNHFQARDSDTLVVTNPKSGTTWFKSLIFALLNRKQFPADGKNHPLLTQNPHNLVFNLGHDVSSDNLIAGMASSPSPRFFATHMPYASLPESLKNNSTCKIVYVFRDVKDTFVSLYHFINKLRIQTIPIERDFEMFSKGISMYGPCWDHALEYLKRSKEDPDRVFFLKYEDMKEQPGIHLRRLAEFLACPFSGDEEESGRVEEILKLCSFDNLSSLEVNNKGIMANGMENKNFFRKGEIGDWKNYLSAEMAHELDKIAQEKFFGSGLV